MEPTTEVKETKKAKSKTSHMKGLEILKKDFSRIGELHKKMKNVKSGPERADVRNRHLFDMNAIKKSIKAFKLEVLNDEDLQTYRKLLTWERQRRLINVSDEYTLNKLEAETLEDSCECFNSPPSGLRCKLGGVYKHTSYYDEARGKEMFVTYIPVVVAPESQIGQELEWKMAQGFMPTMADYPKAKVLWHRRVLVDTEWQRYFREI